MNESLITKMVLSLQHQEFKQHTGIVAPMLLNNIDTDQIIPSREMKKVSKEGLGEGLFAGQRYLPTDDRRTPNLDFILNKQPFDKASILISCKNFGCGSSREHAVWALKEYGFKAIIAQSFGNIFRINCLRNGIVPIMLTEGEITQLTSQVSDNPAERQVTIDLENLQVILPNASRLSFALESHFQDMLINGLDFISLTMRRKDKIGQFIAQDKSTRPWAHL